MNTREFLSSLGAIVIAPWGSLTRSDPKPKLGQRLSGIGPGNCIGKVAIDPRRPDERWVIMDSLGDWVMWKGNEISNFRRNKWWVYDLDGKRGVQIAVIEHSRVPSRSDFELIEFYEMP